jgi:hypothetical protein
MRPVRGQTIPERTGALHQDGQAEQSLPSGTLAAKAIFTSLFPTAF